jgi:hypothetical protein
MGKTDKDVADQEIMGSLAIILDTANMPRIDDNRFSYAKEIIKIDHHLVVDSFNETTTWVDSSFVATCEMITKLAIDNKLLISPTAATYLYAGIITDSGRYLYPATTPLTLKYGAHLIECGADLETIHDFIYTNNIKEIRVRGYVMLNFNKTANGLAYIKVDKEASVLNSSSGEVKYIWQSEDLDEPGEYYAWWSIDIGDYTIETSEFLIIIAEHAPGIRTKTGAIYRQAKAFLAATWKRLEESNNYGDFQLQNQINVAKLSLLGYEIPAEDETNLDIRVISYIAKLTVISVIPAGKDYWASMAQSKTVGNPNESVSYPDRIIMLEQLHDQLAKELAADRSIIGDILEIPKVRRSNDIPGTSDGTDEGYITPNPNTHFRDYGFPVEGNSTVSRYAVRGSRYW